MKKSLFFKKGISLCLSGMLLSSVIVMNPIPVNSTLQKATAASFDTIEYNKVVDLDANIAYPETNSFWSQPYYSSGSSFISSATTTAYAKKDVKLVREAKTARGIYYQVKLDGKMIGWLDKRAFKFYSNIKSEETINRPAIITTVSGHAVWSKPYELVGTSRVNVASAYQNNQVQLLKKAVTDRGTYYQFSASGKTIGWLDERAFDIYDNVEYNKVVNLSGKITNGVGHSFWTKPYKTLGTKLIEQASAYQNENIEIIREAKTSRSTYYQVSANNQIIGWLDKRAVELYSPYIVQEDTVIRDSPNDNSIPIENIDKYTEVNVLEATARDGWIQVSHNNKVGYVKETDIIAKNEIESDFQEIEDVAKEYGYERDFEGTVEEKVNVVENTDAQKFEEGLKEEQLKEAEFNSEPEVITEEDSVESEDDPIAEELDENGMPVLENNDLLIQRAAKKTTKTYKKVEKMPLWGWVCKLTLYAKVSRTNGKVTKVSMWSEQSGLNYPVKATISRKWYTNNKNKTGGKAYFRVKKYKYLIPTQPHIGYVSYKTVSLKY